MKKTICSIVFLCAVTYSYSQTFMHGAGVGLFISKAPNLSAEPAFALAYSPRINFVETESLSLSAGIPLSVGASGSYSVNYDSYYGTTENNSLTFMLNVPLMVNLNVGCGSTKTNDQRFGFFVGCGIGMHYGEIETQEPDGYGGSFYVGEYNASYGPVGNAGVRIAAGHHQKNIEIRCSFMRANNTSYTNVYGLNVFFNF